MFYFFLKKNFFKEEIYLSPVVFYEYSFLPFTQCRKELLYANSESTNSAQSNRLANRFLLVYIKFISLIL